jgi:hypothetical protein
VGVSKRLAVFDRLLKSSAARSKFFPFLEGDLQYFPDLPDCGVLAQLVERLNGIEKVRGSNPLGSRSVIPKDL